MGYSNDPSGLKRSLAAARAEIERLTKERDEARAQVAAAYACGWKDGNHPDADQMPTDAQSALEAYGREKVREGMRRAADIARTPDEDDDFLDWQCRIIVFAQILTEMEKDADQ